MFALCENGIVGFEVVLLEEFGRVDDLHVEEGVTHREEEDRRGRHRASNSVGLSRVEEKGGEIEMNVELSFDLFSQFASNSSCIPRGYP